MGYVLYGVIGSVEAMRPGRSLTHSVVVPLGQGLCLMPVTEDLFDEVQRGDKVDPRFASGQMFPPGFETMLANWSAMDAVAYVAADYFGGVGS